MKSNIGGKKQRGVIRCMAASTGYAFAFIFGLSLLLRVSFLLIVPAEYFLPDSGYEVGAVAQSLATTGQFKDPYSIPTGPTAHTPPLYPAILSLIYRIFGVTLAAGYASWMLAIVGTSFMFGLLPWIAEKLGLPKTAGIIGGIAGALVPKWPAQSEAITAIALGLMLVAFLSRWKALHTDPARSILLGLASGACLHLQPAILPVLLGCLAYEWWLIGRSRSRSHLLLILAGLVTACIPWTWRNYETFHEFFFIRSNLGLELRIANHEGATVERTTERHPRISTEEAQRLKELGELEYMHQARSEALAWIWSNPTAFLLLSARRFAYFWLGPLNRPIAALPAIAITMLAIVGILRFFPSLTGPQRAVIVIPLLTYPLIYYLVCYMDRYRIPVEWMLLMLAGAALTKTVPSARIPD